MEIIKVLRDWNKYDLLDISNFGVPPDQTFDRRAYYSLVLGDLKGHVDLSECAVMSACNDSVVDHIEKGLNEKVNKTYVIFTPVLLYKKEQDAFENFFKEKCEELNNIYKKQFITDFKKMSEEEKEQFYYIVDGYINKSLDYYILEADSIFLMNKPMIHLLLKTIRHFIFLYANKRHILDFKNISSEDFILSFPFAHVEASDATETTIRSADFLYENFDYLVKYFSEKELNYTESNGMHCFLNSSKPVLESYIKEETEKIKHQHNINMYQTKKVINVRVFSRHPSHDAFRNVKVNYRLLFRFGSTTETPEKMKGRYLEVNSIEAVKNSSSKIKMKNCFEKAGVNQADWILPKTKEELINWANKYEETAFVVKSEFGSRNEGNIYCENLERLLEVMENKYGRNFIVEKYYNFSREYRLHVTRDGCFYTCRKMLRRDAPERWFRNSENSVWIVEENELFEKPTIWAEIEQHCVKALNAVGLDVGACDVIVTSAKNKEQKFIVCEINSAPSFGERTFEEYQDIIPTLINQKLTK